MIRGLEWRWFVEKVNVIAATRERFLSAVQSWGEDPDLFRWVCNRRNLAGMARGSVFVVLEMPYGDQTFEDTLNSMSPVIFDAHKVQQAVLVVKQGYRPADAPSVPKKVRDAEGQPLFVGAVVQLHPDLRCYGGMFMVLTELKSFGAEGYVPFWNAENAWYDAKSKHMVVVGKAKWSTPAPSPLDKPKEEASLAAHPQRD